MNPIYMVFWSIVMIIVLSLARIRNLSQIIIVTLITGFVLIMSQTLFMELSAVAGVYPGFVLSDPSYFLAQGLVGWLALLIMPCGWLGPFIGLHVAQRLERNTVEVV